MESQPQNPEFRINPENFHPCNIHVKLFQIWTNGLDAVKSNSYLQL